jgi:glycosyltransferase involved in cell wall biosynthesis
MLKLEIQMRIALIAPEIPDYSIAFAEAISTQCEVLLIAPLSFLRGRDRPQGPKLTSEFIEWPRHRSLRNLLFLSKLLRKIMRFRPDLIHFSNEKNIWLNVLLPLLRAPVVTTVHDVFYHPGDDGWGSVPQWLTHLFIRQSDASIVHSIKLAEQAIKHLPVTEHSVYVLPHLALSRYRDCARQKNLQRSRVSRPQVLFFGRLRRYKGLGIFIDAAKAVVEEIPTAQFVIAGRSDGKTAPDLATATSQFFDVRDRFISDEETAQLFMDADLLVLPYIEASQSGVLAIACTFDLPVVASNVGALGAMVAESGMGIVVPPHDSTSLAKAITRILQDQELYKTCVQNSKRTAMEIGSSNVSSEALGIYCDVIERHRKSRPSIYGRLSRA